MFRGGIFFDECLKYDYLNPISPADSRKYQKKDQSQEIDAYSIKPYIPAFLQRAQLFNGSKSHS